MYVDIIILSLLRHGPVHGYELKQRVRRITLNELSNNSLYPALRRFESSGIATVTVEQQAGRPARNVYAITSQGRDAFDAMIRVLPAELAGNGREFLVRVSFFGEIGYEERLAILQARDAVLAEQLTGLRVLVDEPSRSPDRHWRDVSLAGFVAAIEGERHWIAELVQQAGR